MPEYTKEFKVKLVKEYMNNNPISLKNVCAGSAGAYGTGNNIMTGHTIMSAVSVDRYICTSCGFSEEWIDLDYMDKLKKKYDEI